MSKIQSESNSQHRCACPDRSHRCDQYVKDTIWKQFTTCVRFWLAPAGLWPICQRYNLKAIHNWKRCVIFAFLLWPICQRYNLKAIHNRGGSSLKILTVVTNMSKIQSESNSQLLRDNPVIYHCCDQYVKDTIWKQFTTERWQTMQGVALWPICQRYNLKAIHNMLQFFTFMP